ncbi:epoxide hydrolase family protein [Streptomyces sp. SID3343]|uniref:alpha/beta fold hydrolase n=1 Tax=Streptomyces sp. SID3343 TaxID=2690260 RepID=UPI00136E565C|nr:alpha/beta fold hydrolase [Streptomyces sp. SID3343]
MITPFRIDVPQAELDDLFDRLDRTRWPDELPDAGTDYGVPLERVRTLAEYWRTSYDWRAHEARMNAWPQFTTGIDGENVHFLHIRSADPQALPLILTHGWPGSVVEFLDVIGPLSEEFHVVVPSIPGFGFSGPTHSRGWDVERVARAWAVLMDRLGYDRYGAQGGDWGSGISRALGVVAPDNVVGIHVNYLPTPAPRTPGARDGLSEEDLSRLAQIEHYLAHQPGARVVQATHPQTVAYALTDSPVGQLAWIADRFDDWADPASAISADHIVSDVMHYWLNASAGSSARLHHESGTGFWPCGQPMGVVVFAHDITRSIRAFAEQSYRITHWSEFDRGGHFAAIEAPELFVQDVRTFFRGVR